MVPCKSVQFVLVALAAYAVGSLSGNAAVTWGLVAAAVLAAYLWSRRRPAACGVPGVPRAPGTARQSAPGRLSAPPSAPVPGTDPGHEPVSGGPRSEVVG